MAWAGRGRGSGSEPQLARYAPLGQAPAAKVSALLCCPRLPPASIYLPVSPPLQVRHLPRLVEGVSGALQQERLSRGDLAWLQPYQPSLSASWLLQRAMAPKPGQVAAAPGAGAAAAGGSQAGSSGGSSSSGGGGGWLPPDHVNRLLRCNFGVLRLLGDRVMRPFLKDTLQLGPLAAMMAGMLLRCAARRCGCCILVLHFGVLHYGAMRCIADLSRWEWS